MPSASVIETRQERTFPLLYLVCKSSVEHASILTAVIAMSNGSQRSWNR